MRSSSATSSFSWPRPICTARRYDSPALSLYPRASSLTAGMCGAPHLAGHSAEYARGVQASKEWSKSNTTSGKLCHGALILTAWLRRSSGDVFDFRHKYLRVSKLRPPAEHHRVLPRHGVSYLNQSPFRSPNRPAERRACCALPRACDVDSGRANGVEPSERA